MDVEQNGCLDVLMRLFMGAALIIAVIIILL